MKTSNKQDLLTQEEVREMFSYNEKTGDLVWFKRNDKHNNRLIGKVAGSLNTDGYLRISIRSKIYLAHRLVWLHVHGTWPEQDLDHINGNKSDNRIANLREATDSENNQNRKVRNSNNTSGYPGVYWLDERQKARALISINGKMIHLGYYDTKEEAIAARQEAKNIYHTFNPIDP